MSLHKLRSSKRNKTSDIKGVFIIIRITDQLKTIKVKDKVEDITRLI